MSNRPASAYTTEIRGHEVRIKCHIPGSFNVYNSLAAVGAGIRLGLSVKQIEQGIAALKGVEGRMTRVDEGQDFDCDCRLRAFAGQLRKVIQRYEDR